MRALSIDDRLEAIAGPPAGLLLTPDSQTDHLAMNPLGNKTLYGVYESLVETSSGAPRGVAYGSGSTFLSIRIGPTTADVVLRLASGDTAATGFSAATHAVGVHTAAVVLDVAARRITAVIDGEVDSADVIGFSPGLDGDDHLYTLTNSGVSIAKAAAIYPAAHTVYQRTAIMRRLLRLSGGGADFAVAFVVSPVVWGGRHEGAEHRLDGARVAVHGSDIGAVDRCANAVPLRGVRQDSGCFIAFRAQGSVGRENRVGGRDGFGPLVRAVQQRRHEFRAGRIGVDTGCVVRRGSARVRVYRDVGRSQWHRRRDYRTDCGRVRDIRLRFGSAARCRMVLSEHQPHGTPAAAGIPRVVAPVRGADRLTLGGAQ